MRIHRESLFAALIAWIAAPILGGNPAAAQSDRLPALDRSLVDNRFIFGRTVAAPQVLKQRQIDALNPVLMGLGPKLSAIRADRSVRDRFVTIADFGSGKLGDDRRAYVGYLKIDGNQPVPEFPFGSKPEQGLSEMGVSHGANGVELDGEGAIIENLLVERFRGIGITSRLTFVARDNEVRRCYTGIKAAPSDTFIAHNLVYGMRDYGLWVPRDAGNTQSIGNHYYGARFACKIDPAASFRGTMDTYADAQYGIHSWGWNGQFTACLIQHCVECGVEFHGPGNELNGCAVMVQKSVAEWPNVVGVRFAGERSTMLGGSLELTDYYYPTQTKPIAARAGLVITADLCQVETRLVDTDGANGTVGIRITGRRHGNRIDCRTHGFHQSNDRLLVVDDGGQKDLQVRFRGPDIDVRTATTIGKYIDIPRGWDGSITLVNTTTGQAARLTEGDAY
jgi:hypothetical protein